MSGTRAYLYDSGTGELIIYEVFDLAAPWFWSRTTPGLAADEIHAVGSQLYLLSGGQLYRIDASFPWAPQPPVPVPLPAPATELDQDGDFLYLSQGTRVQILDVSNPSAPLLLASHVLGHGQAPITVHEGYIYAIGGGIHIHAAHNITQLQYVGGSSQFATAGSTRCTPGATRWDRPAGTTRTS